MSGAIKFPEATPAPVCPELEARKEILRLFTFAMNAFPNATDAQKQTRAWAHRLLVRGAKEAFQELGPLASGGHWSVRDAFIKELLPVPVRERATAAQITPATLAAGKSIHETEELHSQTGAIR